MQQVMTSDAFFWALQGLCTLHRKPFSLELARQQLAPPFTADSFLLASQACGFKACHRKTGSDNLHKESFPVLAWLSFAGNAASNCAAGAGASVSANTAATPPDITPALILQADATNVLLVEEADTAPRTMTLAEFNRRYTGQVSRITPRSAGATDADSQAESRQARQFGFRWFVPELLKYKKLWQEILLASLVMQLLALATPLFTQAIIDKVVVHRTESTLVVLVIGMLMFMIFSAGLSWLRQYLVLHTGNRVDAVLGASVFERLFRLPPLYFQHRPTGVITARLQGVETIREFIASAAVSLILDGPFLLIFVAIMFYYSVTLTLIVLAVLSVIVMLSLLVAPMFQSRLQQQFLLGARNQAFITEYVAGLETVKSLQIEPHLSSQYSSYLASYLQASFSTRQIANTYNTSANLLEQLMSLLVLGIGAYAVMHNAEFTIGMLVAFQMFAARLSQPMLRLVGLWQQFQQARLSVDRLGDLMNAPVEPYTIIPSRQHKHRGEIALHDIAFRYAEHLPLVYQNLSLQIMPGQMIGIMGPSGCGKSTLAKLLQGFYQPSAGHIHIDGIDIRYLSANGLRSYFGVVPQETMLFSGTLYDNLQMASPNATFEEITTACKMADIHDVIEAQPRGYQTEIGERGAGLSGGQKQRIAIARALLKRPAILIFDEATSALDGPTAERFAHTINALKGQVTMLFITHAVPKSLRLDAVFRLGENGAQLLSPAVAGSAENTTSSPTSGVLSRTAAAHPAKAAQVSK